LALQAAAAAVARSSSRASSDNDDELLVRVAERVLGGGGDDVERLPASLLRRALKACARLWGLPPAAMAAEQGERQQQQQRRVAAALLARHDDAAAAVITAALHFSHDTEELAAVAAFFRPRLGAVHVSAALARGARLLSSAADDSSDGVTSSCLLRRLMLELATERESDLLEPGQRAQVLWALGRLWPAAGARRRADDEQAAAASSLGARLLEGCAAAPNALTPKEVIMALSGAAELGLAAGGGGGVAAAAAPVVPRSRRRRGGGGAAGAAAATTSPEPVAVSSSPSPPPPPQLVQALLRRLRPALASCSAADLSSAARALALLHSQGAPSLTRGWARAYYDRSRALLLQTAGATAAATLSLYGPSELASALWSAAVLHGLGATAFPDGGSGGSASPAPPPLPRPWLQAAASACMRLMGEFDAPQLEQLSWALAQLSTRKDLAGEAELGGGSAMGSASAAAAAPAAAPAAVSSPTGRQQELVDALAAAAIARAPSRGLPSAARVMCALSRMPLRPSAGWLSQAGGGGGGEASSSPPDLAWLGAMHARLRQELGGCESLAAALATASPRDLANVSAAVARISAAAAQPLSGDTAPELAPAWRDDLLSAAASPSGGLLRALAADPSGRPKQPLLEAATITWALGRLCALSPSPAAAPLLPRLLAATRPHLRAKRLSGADLAMTAVGVSHIFAAAMETARGEHNQQQQQIALAAADWAADAADAASELLAAQQLGGPREVAALLRALLRLTPAPAASSPPSTPLAVRALADAAARSPGSWRADDRAAPRELAALLRACVAGGVRPPPRALGRLLEAAARALPTASPRELSALGWGVARVALAQERYQQQQRALAAAAAAASAAAAAAHAAAASSSSPASSPSSSYDDLLLADHPYVASSSSSSFHDVPAAWLQAYAYALVAHMDATTKRLEEAAGASGEGALLRPCEASRALWALWRLRCPPNSTLIDAAYRYARPERMPGGADDTALETFTPDELATAACALAGLAGGQAPAPRGWVAALAAALDGPRLASLSAQGLAALGRALAALGADDGALPPGWVRRYMEACAARGLAHGGGGGGAVAAAAGRYGNGSSSSSSSNSAAAPSSWQSAQVAQAISALNPVQGQRWASYVRRVRGGEQQQQQERQQQQRLGRMVVAEAAAAAAEEEQQRAVRSTAAAYVRR
jgi:hypothetical protein